MDMLNLEEQDAYLQQVSRTFALTIPLFPEFLADCVSNAYLLCRIADTVEDDPLCEPAHKIQWLEAFGRFCAGNFADKMQLLTLHKQGCELVRAGAKPAELKLFEDLPRVVHRTLSYPEIYCHIIARGVSILCFGMAKSVGGTAIETLNDVDHYCYAVAGVVGETLACLFAAYDPKIKKPELLNLSVSFGEGLQLTNIIKDRFTDLERKARFLPQECFESDEQLLKYLAITQGHLSDSLDFIRQIPTHNKGIREFCLLNIIMASATLQYILRKPKLKNAKISRHEVKKLYILCKICARSNWLTSWLFFYVSRNLPYEKRDPVQLRNKVTLWESDLTTLSVDLIKTKASL